MSVPPRVTITAIRLELGQLSHAYANSLSSLHAILATLIADEAAYVPDDVLTELETLEASLCKKFDVLVNISNSTTAFYHTLVQRHGDCEQSIKELTASSNSNIVTNSNQLLQNMKTQVEQTMLLMEEVQHGTWEITQDMQILYNVASQVIKKAKNDRTASLTQTNEMERDLNSGPGQAE